jgi:hypothetical protein
VTNQNYAQVTDLVAAQQLNWVTDSIVAMLTQGAPFNTNHLRLSDTGVRALFSSQIQGRWLDGDMAMGLPAIFGQVASGQVYQVIVAKDDGRNDPQLLAYFNEGMDGEPLSVLRGGTFIIRPTQENLPTPPDTMEPPPTSGFWMKL